MSAVHIRRGFFGVAEIEGKEEAELTGQKTLEELDEALFVHFANVFVVKRGKFGQRKN